MNRTKTICTGNHSIRAEANLRENNGVEQQRPGAAAAGIPVLSFFTGGGFLDLGFEQAGFRTVWSNEFNPALADLHDFGYTAWRRASNPNAPEAKISSRL